MANELNRGGVSRRGLLAGTAVGGAGIAAALLESNPVFAAATGPGETFAAPLAAQPGGMSFVLDVPRRQLGAFLEISGLEMEVDVIEIAEGTGAIPPQKFSGRTSFQSFTLSRPLTDSVAAAAWLAQVQSQGSGPARAATCTLRVMDGRSREVATYNLTNAWPSKIEIGSLKADGGMELIEALTMTCEFIQRVAV